MTANLSQDQGPNQKVRNVPNLGLGPLMIKGIETILWTGQEARGNQSRGVDQSKRMAIDHPTKIRMIRVKGTVSTFSLQCTDDNLTRINFTCRLVLNF